MNGKVSLDDEVSFAVLFSNVVISPTPYLSTLLHLETLKLINELWLGMGGGGLLLLVHL